MTDKRLDAVRPELRRQTMKRLSDGRAYWAVDEWQEEWPAESVALLLCDVWDHHWCRGAEIRLEAMLPRMNALATHLREMGALIIHAPSNTMEFYASDPARRRALAIPLVKTPPDLPHDEPPLPVDASDGGCDTWDGSEPRQHRPWTRQHKGITVDQDRDLVVEEGQIVYSAMQQRGINHLLIMGVHTNMCILNRTFAIKQMVRWGVDIALVRDLTDAMYNPALSPYVSHDAGTGLVIEYIEKFWCPTVHSFDLMPEMDQ